MALGGVQEGGIDPEIRKVREQPCTVNTKVRQTLIHSNILDRRVVRDRGEIVQHSVEIWEGFKGGAAFDLDLNRRPGPGRQVRKRHFKHRQGDKEGLGSWHEARGSVLKQKEGGRNGQRGRS